MLTGRRSLNTMSKFGTTARPSTRSCERDFVRSSEANSEIRRDWDPYNLPEDVLERARQRAAELENGKK